jgi:predicted  nucleic acid-binding Zn-ribbon protein
MNIFGKVMSDGCPNCGSRQFSFSFGSGFFKPMFEEDKNKAASSVTKSESITCMSCEWSQSIDMHITTTPGLGRF